MKSCNLFDLYGLFMGFVVGVFLTILTVDSPQIVMKHPTPYNTKNITYVDDEGKCYQYRADSVVCPTNNQLITEFPDKNI